MGQFNTDLFNVSLYDKNGSEYVVDTTSIESLYFIEDVFSFCMMGKLRFTDYTTIIEDGNFWGYLGESVSISYSGASKSFKMYKINKHSPSQSELEKDNVFEIIFVSPLYYQWHYTQYSRSWKNKKTTDIMEHLMKFMIGSTFYSKTFESSNERIEYFHTNLKSPAENFQYLMERSTGIVTGLPGYVCFENLDGYNLCSLPNLMKKGAEIMDPKGGDNIKYRFYSENPHLDNKIYSFERFGIDNGSMLRLSGGHRLGYDIKRKKNFDKQGSYGAARGKFQDHLLGKPQWPILDPSISGARYYKTGEDREDFVDNMYYNNWIKQYSNQQLIEIYVRGHSARKAGGVIQIEWPSVLKNRMNKNFTGKYFVKSVVHFFNKEQPPYFQQKLVLMKNQYDDINVPS